MICIFDKDSDGATFSRTAVWSDGEWVEGGEHLDYLSDEMSEKDLLDHFSGPGYRLAIEAETLDDAPETLEIGEEDKPTVDLDGSNWLQGDPEEDTQNSTSGKLVAEMSRDEIYEKYDEDRAERIIQSLEDKGHDFSEEK